MAIITMALINKFSAVIYIIVFPLVDISHANGLSWSTWSKRSSAYGIKQKITSLIRSYYSVVD